MSQEFIKAKDLALKWEITSRRINQLCSSGLIPGAFKSGKFWFIPADAPKPPVLRKKEPANLPDSALSRPLLPCPVGITSYKEVSTECYYVDKTMMIKDLIDDHSKVYLFTRPRRFGKTLAMDMIRTYFEKTDEDTSCLFTTKKIWRCGNRYRKAQGQYPVIFLSFKDAHQNNYAEMYQSLCFLIKEEFLRHIDLLASTSLNEYDKAYYKSIINQSATLTDYQFSLGKLSSMLAAHYHQKVILIIDEYDTPIQQGHLYGYYDEIVAFVRNLFSSVLKDNSNLEFAVLTGILRIARESLFSGLNNLFVNTILDQKYSDYFGFQEDDIVEMARYYGQAEKVTEIKEWYDGYLFGDHEIYNPWSVISYFNNNCRPKAFWSRTSGNEIISELIQNTDAELYSGLSHLLQGGEVQAMIDTDIIYPEINGNPDTVYSFLLVSGYLRISSVISEFNDNQICSLSLPNREIKSIFQKEIMDQFSAFFKGSTLRDFETSLRLNDVKKFTNTLQQYLMQSASTFDTANENFYHGMVFGMLAIMSDQYYISSNRESGEGRFDISLEPKNKLQAGYIIEFKAGKDLTDEELLQASQKAIRQIRSKEYYTELQYHGIRQIELFGLAFSGKHVVCEHEPLLADSNIE